MIEIGKKKRLIAITVVLILIWSMLSVGALAERDDIPIRISVIGFGVDSGTEDYLRQVAAAGSGQYYGAQNEEELVRVLGEAVGAPSFEDTVIAEVEKNDSLGKANPIAVTGRVGGTIDPRGDYDWYRFDVKRQGAMDVIISEVAADLDIVFRLWDENGKTLTGWIAPKTKGAVTEAFLDLKAAGRYYLELADGGGDAGSSQPYKLQTTYHPGDDLEPNATFGRASRIKPGVEITANILPKKDEDWLGFEVKRQGSIEVTITDVADDLDIVFRLWNADGKTLTGWVAPKTKGGDTHALLYLPAPGFYFLQIADGGGDASSPKPYRLKTDYQTGDDLEPNDSFGRATDIAPGREVKANILPKGDQDWYVFNVDRQGILETRITDVPEDLDIVLRLWNADVQSITGWFQPKRQGGDVTVTLNLPSAGRYCLQLADGGNNAGSPEQYRLETTYHAGDDHEPNNSLGQAKMITPGQAVTGNILPLKDHDWYRFDVDRQGTLTAHISNVADDLDIVFRVWNSDARAITGWFQPPRPGADVEAAIDLPEASAYFLQVADGGNNASSPVPYTLKLEFKP